MYNLTHHLDLAMRLAARITAPKVYTAKNVNSAPIEPPDLVYGASHSRTRVPIHKTVTLL